MSSTKIRFCIYCGKPSPQDKPTDECAHSYKSAKQMLSLCKLLYEDASWVLYTVENEILSVYMVSSDFMGEYAPVGSGGIVLRNPQIIFKSWQLQNAPAILQFLGSEFNLNPETSLEIISLLWHLNDLLVGQSSAWPIEDLFFIENCPTISLNQVVICPLLDKFGELQMSSILKYCILHGQWDAKNHF
jgi:hypothetical protein